MSCNHVKAIVKVWVAESGLGKRLFKAQLGFKVRAAVPPTPPACVPVACIATPLPCTLLPSTPPEPAVVLCPPPGHQKGQGQGGERRVGGVPARTGRDVALPAVVCCLWRRRHPVHRQGRPGAPHVRGEHREWAGRLLGVPWHRRDLHASRPACARWLNVTDVLAATPLPCSDWEIMVNLSAVGWGMLLALCIWPPVATLLPRQAARGRWWRPCTACAAALCTLLSRALPSCTGLHSHPALRRPRPAAGWRRSRGGRSRGMCSSTCPRAAPAPPLSARPRRARRTAGWARR